MRRKAAAILLALVTALGLLTAPAAGATGLDARGHWQGIWAAAMQAPTPGFDGTNWSPRGFENHSVRQIVRVNGSGAAARFRFSNRFGSTPLRITGGTVARAEQGAAVRPGSVRPLTFAGSRSAQIPAGGELLSDPAVLRVEPLERLTVTLYFAEPTGPATLHLFADATSYRATGDHRADTGAGAFTETSGAWYYLTGVEVIGLPPRDAIVAFGDSITEGAFSTVDADNRYPDELAESLAARGDRRSVLNTGIGGNRVLTDSPCLGEKATTRFQRDVLDQPRAGTVIVLEGINDIGLDALPPGDTCFQPGEKVTAEALITAYRDLIQRARRHGIKVIGGTLLPYKGAFYFSAYGEQVRDQVNHWIRTSGEYDAVVDFDRMMADPADPDSLLPAYDSGDKLHPNDAGYRAMAEAVRPAIG